MKVGFCFSSIMVVVFSNLLKPALGSSHVEKAELSRRDFPSDFIFGVAASAYQVDSPATISH